MATAQKYRSCIDFYSYKSRYEDMERYMQSYPLDLKTLLHILSRQTGELRATQVRLAGVRKPCQAYLKVIKGSVDISSCLITLEGRIVLAEKDALELLLQVGTLDWIYTASKGAEPSHTVENKSSVTVIQRLPAPVNNQPPLLIPIRTRSIDATTLLSWPRLYRSIYNLADGNKTVAEILEILNKNFEEVAEVLSHLKQNGLIRFLEERK